MLLAVADEQLLHVYAAVFRKLALSNACAKNSLFFRCQRDVADLLNFLHSSQVIHPNSPIEAYKKYIAEFDSFPNLYNAHYYANQLARDLHSLSLELRRYDRLFVRKMLTYFLFSGQVFQIFVQMLRAGLLSGDVRGRCARWVELGMRDVNTLMLDLL